MNSHTAVLGAGFSLAFGGLPLVDGLGETVRELVAVQARARPRSNGIFDSAPSTFSGGSFERWLSRIAEPQPDLSDESNLANQHAFRVVTAAIHEVLLNAERRALNGDVPNGLQRLVTCWHALRATVITFNYDTLLERAASQVVDPGAARRVNTYSLLNNLPPEADPGTWDYERPETMRILKLHGSLDTFWVPGDVSGTTITRLGETSWNRRAGATNDDVDLERVVPGRVPFIVPPASAKSALFANPITRQLWRTAAERLSQSNSIDIVGYSLPMTDLVANAMIAESFRRAASRPPYYGTSTRIVVANPNPNPVIDSLTAAGVDGAAIDPMNSITAYLESLERELAEEHLPALLEALRTAGPVYVRAADGKRFGVREASTQGDKVVLGMVSGESSVDGPSIVAEMVTCGSPEVIAHRKGGRTPVIAHQHDDDGALVLVPTWLDDYNRR
jgi:hypothetical protein